ncbi:MAG: class I adenylate-forming enzyme family protein [Clostridia bacterium]|nr:class I adenylate-forming enzyme family protein [Clostridia bacterium]
MKDYLMGFKEVFEREYTWKEGFMRNVFRYANKLALFFPETEEKWTYKELNKEVNRLANKLLKDNVGHGDVVMYQLLNCPVFAFAYVATHKIGAVSCPVNYRLSAGEIALTIDDSRPKVFIYEAEQEEVIKQAVSMAEYPPEILIMTDVYKKAKAMDGAITYEEYVKESQDTEPGFSYELSIYDETTRLYTSGTTGRQKGVPLTSINELLSAHDIMIHFPMNQTDITMNTTPWFHRGGLHCGGPTPTFYAGGTIIIMRKFIPRICLEFIEKYKLTFIVGVPAVLEQLTETQLKEGRNLSSLKGIVTMGSPLERAACIRFQEVLTPNIFNGYGTTESLWNTFLRPFDLPERAGTAGGSCVDDDVRVVRVYDDRRAEPDDICMTNNIEVGEVIMKAPAKSPYAYYNNPEETERKYYKGYLYTNDLATWDKDHYVSICGRKDDMIISAGENIYPTQVEEVLNSHPKVADCIVTAAPDKARGELVTAYIVKNDPSLTYEELEKFCKESPMIANYKRPRYYRFINEIPMNMTGKKLHYKAKEMAQDDLVNGLLYRV